MRDVTEKLGTLRRIEFQAALLDQVRTLVVAADLRRHASLRQRQRRGHSWVCGRRSMRKTKTHGFGQRAGSGSTQAGSRSRGAARGEEK